jgi:hypothetical protein
MAALRHLIIVSTHRFGLRLLYLQQCVVVIIQTDVADTEIY